MANGPLEIVVLGSGTCVPTGSRGPSAYAVRSGESITMVDMGAGSLEKLARCGMSYMKIDAVVITHFHVDHTSELSLFLFTNNCSPEKRRTSPLTIVGPEGTGAFLSRMESLYRWVKPKEYNIEVIEGEAPSADLASNLKLSTVQADHGDGNAISVRFDTPSGSVTFSGDTGYSEALVGLAKDTDLLIIECSFPAGTESDISGHLTPHLAARVAKNCSAGRVVLTHLYPRAVHSDPKSSFLEVHDTEVMVAHDLMRLTL